MKTRIMQALDQFFFKPASAIPLAALRIALSLVLLLQAFIMRNVAYDLLGSFGYVQGELAKSLNNPNLPQVGHLQNILALFGLSEVQSINFVCLAYVASLVLLAVGWQSRISAILVWFLHWVLMNSANSTTYGADIFAHVFLFYLIWVPCGQAWSLDALRNGDLNPLSSSARLGTRILQLHLCIAYLISGIDKAMGEQWWNGELMWRALQMPVYKQFDMSWLASFPHLSMLIGWGTLILEIGYCVFIWPKQTRKLWVAGILGLHFGIIVMMGLHIFGLIMMILTACLFGLSLDNRARNPA